MPYKYYVTLQGSTDRDRTTLQYDLGEPADHAAALSAANQIRGSLVDITKANIKSERLVDILSEDNTLPADNSADTFEEALVMCHVNAPAEAKKLTPIRVPAPEETIFLPDGEIVDTSDALLIQFIQQVSQHAYVSDGEQVNTSSGSDGMDRGWKRSRAKTFKQA